MILHFIRWLVLGLILLEPVPQIRTLPRTNLIAAVKTGTTHAALVWRDGGGVWQKEQLTAAEYLAIGNGTPRRPAAFVGTNAEWVAAWTSGQAYALGGRPSLTTPTGEPVLGIADRRITDGAVTIYTGDDLDVGVAPVLVLRAMEYTGTFPLISTPAARCGITITAGQIQPGNLDVACARGTVAN